MWTVEALQNTPEYQIGDRVSRAIDVSTKPSILKRGIVTCVFGKRFRIPEHRIYDDYGNEREPEINWIYPLLYAVKWDDGTEGNYLPHGIDKGDAIVCESHGLIKRYHGYCIQCPQVNAETGELTRSVIY